MNPGNPAPPNPFDPNQLKPAEPRVKTSHRLILYLVLAALIVTVGWLIVSRTKRAIGWFHNKRNEVAGGKYSGKRFDTTYTQSFDPSVKTAKLTVNGGTSNYTISDTTSQLLRADAMLYHSRYVLSGHKQDSVYTMELNMKSKSKIHFGNQSDSLNLKLNLAPVWDINVNSGATDLEFDLSKYKIRTFKVKCAAATFNIKIGQPLAQTNIDIKVGSADITINIPKNAPCRIIEDSSLSSSDFDGFTKKDDGSYETKGFASAKNKILIHFSGGLSDFNVNRY